MTYEKEIIYNLIKLLDTKKVFFDQVLEITNKQKIDIETNEADNLSALVGEKQEAIDKVNQIDKAFAVQFDLLKNTLNIDTLEKVDYTKYPELKTLKQKVEQIVEVAGKIMAEEKENSDKINAIFNHVKSELKNIKRGKVSLRAYDKPIINLDGVYLDKKK